MGSLESDIVIVSGLPRSGTSLMMQMLAGGGLDVVTDNIRNADIDNPRGYFEFEQVKQIERDVSWLPAMRGRCFKMVSQLLYHLPATETCRIIFMERDLEETIQSQERMLERLGRKAAPRAAIKAAYLTHLERLHEWLERQANMRVLRVRFADLIEAPQHAVASVAAFLDSQVDTDAMTRAVDPTLYRSRTTLPAASRAAGKDSGV